MRVIAHLSDLHFGRESPHLAEALLAELQTLRPHLVAVSGDLTQRAREQQFAAARAFLRRVPAPVLVVPGNHDIPLWNVLDRFLRPLDGYRRHISRDVNPVWEDEELLVMGVSTARSRAFKGGRISWDQVATLHLRAGARGDARFKVLVAHHPFTPPAWRPTEPVLGRGLAALRALEGCGLDLILTGHLHRVHLDDVRAHFHRLQRSVLAAHAGSAISDRLRGEPNAWNVVRVSPPDVAFETRSWDGRGFAVSATARYRRAGHEWVRVVEGAAGSFSEAAGAQPR